MAATSSYKNYERQQRVMTVESLHNKGMYYADVPLNEGYVKTLLNMDINDTGTSLTPRGGYKEQYIDKTSLLPIVDGTMKYTVFASGATYVLEHDESDATLYRYALIGKSLDNVYAKNKYIPLSDSILFIYPASVSLDTALSASDKDTKSWYCTYNGASNTKVLLRNTVQNIHGTVLAEEHGDKPLHFSRSAIYTTLNGNVYFSIYGQKNMLGYLKIVKSTSGAPTWEIAQVEPKDVQPTQAINYGYNMLTDDPYTFLDNETATGAIQLNGLVPKDSKGNIVFTSRVGEAVTFYLNYQYPGVDKDKKKYLVQWEIKDLDSDSDVTTLEQVRKSTVYTPGDKISLTITPPYRQFTLIVKVYYQDVVDAVTYVDDETDYKTLTPERALVLASYYLTSDNSTSMRNVEPVNYDLATCKGMCAWQQRLVLWGVAGAESTLFVSEPNAPEYVPYPNNSEMFTESVVHCVPYMGKLLVFTSNSIYAITMSEDGLTYSTKCIQDNLIMLEDDAHTVRTVRNMVYFRSGNYYHMVVPNTTAGVGEVQLAPISRPITGFLDDFKNNVVMLMDDVYNIKQVFDLREANNDTYVVKLCDYTNYLEGNKMLNVYKCAVCINKLNEAEQVYYVDFVLSYDTVQRTWVSYLHESNPTRSVPFIQNVADNTSYITVAPGSTEAYLVVYKADNTDVSDEVTLYTPDTGRDKKYFPNYQFLDTGNRSHNAQLKKRFREIQLSINNVQKTKLDFYTSFLVDDDTRKDMFAYQTVHVTDKTDPNYGLVFVERVMNDPLTAWGETLFAEDDTGWTVDFSRFPNINVAKVHLKVTGKGYNGRLRVLSKNKTKYEILTTNWVYRPMYGR